MTCRERGPYQPLPSQPVENCWFSFGDGAPPLLTEEVVVEGSPAKAGTKFAAIFVVGTIATFAVAGFLVLARRPVAAGAVIVASPFPCPPGMPC